MKPHPVLLNIGNLEVRVRIGIFGLQVDPVTLVLQLGQSFTHTVHTMITNFSSRHFLVTPRAAGESGTPWSCMPILESAAPSCSLREENCIVQFGSYFSLLGVSSTMRAFKPKDFLS